MGTIPHKFETASGKRSYRRHSTEFKQSVVEQSYAAGASVARLAQQHQINANQIFAWRKWARDQTALAPDSAKDAAVFLPITVIHETDEPTAAATRAGATVGTEMPAVKPAERIEVAIGAARLVIHGAPDAATLRALLAQLLR